MEQETGTENIKYKNLLKHKMEQLINYLKSKYNISENIEELENIINL